MWFHSQQYQTSLCVYVQKRTLYLRHRLQLVTTSHECSHVAKEIPRSAQQTMDDGDAMAASPMQAEAVQQEIMASSNRSVPAMEVCTSAL